MSATELLINSEVEHCVMLCNHLVPGADHFNWTGLAELIKAFKPNKQREEKKKKKDYQGSYWYLLNDFHLLFYL